MEAPQGTLLLSGGIDSPVAGHLMASQGAEVFALHCSLEPFTDSAPEVKSKTLARTLGFSGFYVAHLGDALAEIARKARRRYYFVLSKRLMFRVAETLAHRLGASFLLTGESLGQVSSQTLWNLRAIEAAVDLPVIRPLIGWDKVDIVREAEAIGSYPISVGPEVCDVLGPAHPTTRAKLEVVEAEEARLPYEELLEGSVATLSRAELTRAPVAEAK
ncbi:MAG: tRNA sulfurtransferase [Thermoplasmata archaeon]